MIIAIEFLVLNLLVCVTASARRFPSCFGEVSCGSPGLPFSCSSKDPNNPCYGLDGSDGEESACNAGDSGSIPDLGGSLGEENSNPLQFSCLENSRDREAWWATVHGVSNIRIYAHTHARPHTQSQSPLSTMDTTSSIHHFLANICQRARRKVKNFNTHQEYFLSN